VISAYYYGPAAFRRITRDFFRKTRKPDYELATSDITIREIRGAPALMRVRLDRILVAFEIKVWKTDHRVRDLAAKYVAAKVIPAVADLDAQHVAAASILNMDALVSWNLRHIVNLRTKLAVQRINSDQRVHTPSLIRPDEVS